MKKTKIVTLLSFSALACIALASCGNGGGGKDEPGFYVYATSEDSGLYNDACISYEAKSEVTYNKDLVISIKPNQYFSLKDKDNKMIIPYVGLGNPSVKFSHPLIQDMAWTYTDKSIGDAQAFELTVKGEYFVKNVVISYGDSGAMPGTETYEPVRCMSNELYFTKPNPVPDEERIPIVPENLGTFDRTTLSHATHPLTNAVFDFTSSKSKANFANENLTFAFKVKDNQANLIANDLLDLKAYEVTQAIEAESTNAEAPVSEFKYIKVIGRDETSSTNDVILSQRTVSGPNITVNVDKDQKMLYVNIPWAMVIKESQTEGQYGYINKFKQIDFQFDPVYMNHVTEKGVSEFDITFTPKVPADIKDYRAGYITEDVVSGRWHSSYDGKIWDFSTFRQNGTTRFDYTDSGVHSEDLFDGEESDNPIYHHKQLAREYDTRDPEPNNVYPGFAESAVDQEALTDKSPSAYSVYSANFIADSINGWPTVIIQNKDATGGVISTVTFNDDVTVKTTGWRNNYYSSTRGKQFYNEELDYKEIGNWRLVLLNNREREVGVESFDEALQERNLRGQNNAYVLYTLNGTKAFEGCKKIEIVADKHAA